MRSEGILKIDVLEGLRQIETASQDLIIADPPYYKAINEKWDKQWKTEQEYLDWCKLWFDECVRILKPTGSFYCYGNFDILSKQKVLIFDKQLNFRQNITLDKGLKSIAGRTNNKLRMFPTASEYLLFYVKKNDNGTSVNEYLRSELNKFGIANDVNKHFWNNGWAKQGSNIASHFFGNNEQNCLPTIEQYKRLQTTGYFQKEYSELEAMYLQDRFIFNLPYATTDVWDFTPDKVRYCHPTQKPQDICQRIIKASSNENDNVLIPFAGSGSEIVACEELKRNWVAFEIEDSYIEIINKRLDGFKTKLF